MFHNVLHAGFILCILLVFVINTDATLSFTTISTAAGSGSTTFSGDNGAATSAGIRTPAGIAFDSSGNIYVSDAFRVRKITIATGIISTYVGTGSTTYSGDNGVASSATLYNPQGLDFDSSNNLYIAEKSNNRLRKVTYTTSIISTIAGTGSTANNGAVITADNGPATSGILYNPCGVAVDSSGNVYIGDFNNHRIRKVTAATNIISTVAGTGTGGYSGDGGAATSALIKRPYCVTIDSSGNIYFGDYNGFNVVRKITVSTGIISTVAGTWSNNGGYSGDNGAATSAALNYPIGVSLDGSSNLYITDYKNNRIRKVDVSTGLISTVVGTGTASSTGDAGSATSATVKGPFFSRFDSGYNNFYITEYDGNLVRKVFTDSPTIMPTSVSPTFTPTTRNPTVIPTRIPTKTPTFVPTVIPTTPAPTLAPTQIPTKIPTKIPTFAPTMIPTVIPTKNPTVAPTLIPTEVPTFVPTDIPTETPTFEPTFAPSFYPTETVNENSTALILPSFGVGVWNDPNTAVSGAAVSADGELYLSDSGTQMVMRYDTSASSWVSYISPNNISLNSSLSIHIPNSNRRRLSYSISSNSVFVTDTYNNRVLLCNATNSCIDYVSASLGYTPYSAVVSYKDGYVYFRSTNKIVKCTGINVCSNYFSTSMILNGRSVTAGFNIAFDDLGYVFFQDTDARRIVKCKTGSSSASCAEYTTADELYDNVTLGNYSLNTIGVDSFRSWVYISDMDNSRVILCKGSSSCSAIMSSLTYIENVEFTSPSCFTIDSNGAIYVVDMTRVILYLEQGVVITDSPSYVPSFSPSAEPTFAPTKYVYSLYDPLSLGVYGSVLALSILIWLGLLIVMVMFSLSQTNDRSFEASYKLSPAVYTIAFCAMVQLSDYVYWFTVNFQNGFLFIVYGGILFVFPTLPFIYELYHLRAHPSMFIHYYPGKAFAHNWLGLYGICYFWLSMDPAGHPLFLMRHQHKTTYHNIGFHFAEHESILKMLYFILLWIILVVLQVVTLIPFYLWCLFFTPYFMLLLITGVFAYQFKFMSISTVWNLWFRYWVGHTERFEKSIINNIDTDHLNKSIFVYFIVALGPILGSQFYNYQHATDAEKSQFLYWFPPIIGSILFIGSCIRYSYWILHKGVNLGDVPVRLSFGDDAHLDNHKETKNARLVKNYDRKKNLLKIDHLIENFVLEEIDDWSKSVDRVVSGHLSSVKSDVKQKIYEHKNKLIGRFRKFKYQISREDAANEVWRLLMTSCVDFRIVEWLQAQEITEPSHLVGISPKLREDLIKQIPRGDNDVVVKRKIRTLLEMIFIDHNESILVRNSSKRLANADDSIDVNRISLVNTDKGDHLIVDSENELSADIHMLQSVKSQTYKSVTKIDPFVDRNSEDDEK